MTNEMIVITCAVAFGGIFGYVLRECVPRRMSVKKKLEMIQYLMPSEEEIHSQLGPDMANYAANKLLPATLAVDLTLARMEVNHVPLKYRVCQYQ